MASRDLTSLYPAVADKARTLIKKAKDVGIELIITATWRSDDEQDALYAIGRTRPGHIVTHAKAGQSYHNWRCAFDVVPLRHGKCIWNAADPVWAVVGRLGKEAGLAWGGDFTHPDMPHFQFTGGLTLADLADGKEP